jgi:hypothetical protein
VTSVTGALLMLLNTVVDVGKGVLFFPILENHGKRSALAYLALIVVQVVMLDVRVLALLLIVPLIQWFFHQRFSARGLQRSCLLAR